MKNSYLGTLALSLLTMAACAGAQVKPQSLEKVKSVAVVNFRMQDQMGTGGTGGRGGGIGGSISAIRDLKAVANGEAQARHRAQVEAIYDTVVDKLAAAGFTTTKRSDIAANPKFVEIYTKLPQIPAADPDPGAFAVYGGRFDLRNPASRAQLLDSLGVDAVADIQVTTQVGKTGGASIGGFGALKRYPQAVVSMTVYDRNEPSPIWTDYRVLGNTASDGLQETMGVKDTKDPTPLFLETVTSAMDKALARLQHARQQPQK
jgi:hypothetical protein